MNLAHLRAALQEALAALEESEATPTPRRAKPRRRRAPAELLPRREVSPELEAKVRRLAQRRGLPF